ncbi:MULTISPECIES: hypothetical protein [unclassified Bradyrhizobium]|uniref:hypothetical protein n=1 Tax=unclassified Bradyrhizobium TaxID=2631580 RepID=UPI002305B000|nr:hypothetical protein [Bradyrhizobium sp. CCBAU 21359]
MYDAIAAEHCWLTRDHCQKELANARDAALSAAYLAKSACQPLKPADKFLPRDTMHPRCHDASTSGNGRGDNIGVLLTFRRNCQPLYGSIGAFIGPSVAPLTLRLLLHEAELMRRLSSLQGVVALGRQRTCQMARSTIYSLLSRL